MPRKERTSAFQLAQNRRASESNGMTQEVQQALAASAISQASIEHGSSLQVGPFMFGRSGLQIVGEPTYEQWRSIGDTLLLMAEGSQWWIGDWLAYGEHVWGKTYTEIAEITGYRKKTLYEYRYVASRVEISIRMENLTFAHHQLVASMGPDAQRQWLEFAAEHDLSISQMREAINPKVTPPLPSSNTYDLLFSRENKPNINMLQKLFLKAGQGDIKARENLGNEIERLQGWLDELKRGVSK